MMPEIHYEIRDLKNQIKDLKMEHALVLTYVKMYETGVIRDENELIERIKKVLKN